MSKELGKSYEICDETCGVLCDTVEEILNDAFDVFISGGLGVNQLHERLRDRLEREIANKVTIPMRKSFVEHLKEINNA